MTTMDQSGAAPDDHTVVLVDGDPELWARRFVDLHGRLRRALGPGALIEHIGSTAVPNLPAKDVVDALVGVALDEIGPAAQVLAAAGFAIEGRRDGHVWLSRRREGRRKCIVHVVEAHGRKWQRRIAFRDLLRRDPEARSRYVTARTRSTPARRSRAEVLPGFRR